MATLKASNSEISIIEIMSSDDEINDAVEATQIVGEIDSQGEIHSVEEIEVQNYRQKRRNSDEELYIIGEVDSEGEITNCKIKEIRINDKNIIEKINISDQINIIGDINSAVESCNEKTNCEEELILISEDTTNPQIFSLEKISLKEIVDRIETLNNQKKLKRNTEAEINRCNPITNREKEIILISEPTNNPEINSLDKTSDDVGLNSLEEEDQEIIDLLEQLNQQEQSRRNSEELNTLEDIEDTIEIINDSQEQTNGFENLTIYDTSSQEIVNFDEIANCEDESLEDITALEEIITHEDVTLVAVSEFGDLSVIDELSVVNATNDLDDLKYDSGDITGIDELLGVEGINGLTAIEEIDSDKKIVNALEQVVYHKLNKTGLFERIRDVVKTGLVECGWKTQVQEECRKTLKQHSEGGTVLSFMNLEKTVGPIARSLVPEHLKQVLLKSLQDILIQLSQVDQN